MLDGDPSQITKGSSKKFSWQCDQGHVYVMTVAQRTRGRSCGVCHGKQINVGVNDLASRFPEIAKEAKGWDPTTVTFSSNRNREWVCEDGHTWKANINNRTSQGMGCPYCSGRFPWAGFNDLATTHPEIAKEMYLGDPTKFTFGSGKKVKWKCNQGHIWIASVNERMKNGCPTCHIRFKAIIVGINDLQTTHPEIASQADGWDPKIVTAGSSKKLQWKCNIGHTWITAVGKRTSKDSRNCPVCANQKILVGYNDLNSTHPEIAKLANGWDPKTVFAGTYKKQSWKCSKGHEYTAAVNSVVKGTACLVCCNQVIQPGINDLVTTDPLIAIQADGWDATKIHIGSHKRLPWRCNLGHTWIAVVKSRKKNNCPVCGNRTVVAGFNDLATLFPELSQEADGWDPSSVAFATTKRVSWKCTEGHKWVSTIKNRSQLGRGCPSCATSGYDPNLEGWLYFIEHPVWEMQQIGISNFPKKRITTHLNLGWEVIDLRGPLMGDVARYWETAILRMLKKHGASFTADREQGKFTGFSESWIKTSFSANSLTQLMKLVEEDE